jgi:hypothetical protein
MIIMPKKFFSTAIIAAATMAAKMLHPAQDSKSFEILSWWPDFKLSAIRENG